MSYKVLCFVTKKEGMSFNDFKEYYSHKHVPYVKSLLGDDWPESHSINYIDRSNPSTFLIGSADDFQYDALTELGLRDGATLGATFAKFSQTDISEKVAADEEKFLDRSKTRIMVTGVASVTH